MSWSFKLARIGGIDVKVHVTFILILLWVGYVWGINLKMGPGGALFGVVVTLLLFLCVLLHELAHSFVARRYGVTVRDIILLPIGGMAQMDKMPEKPGEELKMSLAGPLTNIVIVAIIIAFSLLAKFDIITGIAEIYRNPSSVGWRELVPYMALANLFLGIFNLVPAFPMDGGRVLRALLALRLDYVKATKWAVNIGQGLAFLFGLFGVISANWLLFIIAVFIYMGARNEVQTVELKGALEGILVSQAMTRKLQVIEPQARLSQVIDISMETFQTEFPVVEGERLVGLLTEADLLAGFKKQGAESPVSQAMRTKFPVAKPGEPLFDAQQRMSLARLGAIPVVDDGKLVGLLTAQDVNKAYWLLPGKPRRGTIATLSKE